MSKKIVYINDFFLEDFVGGGELNDHELLAILDKDYDIQKIRSNDVTIDFLKENENSFFIISNFINLKISCKDYINDLNYIIYEHDHKYVKSRNPAVYKDFKAGISEIINYHFYKNAVQVEEDRGINGNIFTKDLNSILTSKRKPILKKIGKVYGLGTDTDKRYSSFIENEVKDWIEKRSG